jgi:hypothetical protein
LAATAPTVAEDQFDLNCKVKMTVVLGADERRVVHRTQIYSIDLKNGLWCKRPKCEKASKIAQITPNELNLGNLQESDAEASISIDRDTWRLTGHMKLDDSKGRHVFQAEMEGPCERAPFTPFPDR